MEIKPTKKSVVLLFFFSNKLIINIICESYPNLRAHTRVIFGEFCYQSNQDTNQRALESNFSLYCCLKNVCVREAFSN